ncbi:MAG TPA: hypothetical protein VN612_09270 [Acidobacteriaceae bacterium]|nr:hypothetical protein [Acidobacteriaceae bacterium]
MTPGLKVALGLTAVMLLAFGIEVTYIHYDRNRPDQTAAQPNYGPTDPDDLVFLKRKHPESVADLKDLNSETVWVQAGGQMEYFAAERHRADYAKPAGVLPGGQPLKIVDAFQQAEPKGVSTRVPAGTGQVLLAFTMPKSADAAKLYAAPVGYRDASGYNFFTDDIFFYDDPHKLWDWSPQIWQAIDTHQVIAGMNQRQVSLSLGAIAKQSSGQYGDGEMVYANAGHPVAVTFAKGKVTASRSAAGY